LLSNSAGKAWGNHEKASGRLRRTVMLSGMGERVSAGPPGGVDGVPHQARGGQHLHHGPGAAGERVAAGAGHPGLHALPQGAPHLHGLRPRCLRFHHRYRPGTLGEPWGTGVLKGSPVEWAKAGGGVLGKTHVVDRVWGTGLAKGFVRGWRELRVWPWAGL
jgi:hypothetical protein